jgi:hypothetical protein
MNKRENYVFLYPGEIKAIKRVVNYGKTYGYGNLIHHLKVAWSDSLKEKWGMSQDLADLSAGLICPWCNTDTRNGKKVKGLAKGKSAKENMR